jgi:hypothetical protein
MDYEILASDALISRQGPRSNQKWGVGGGYVFTFSPCISQMEQPG